MRKAGLGGLLLLLAVIAAGAMAQPAAPSKGKGAAAVAPETPATPQAEPPQASPAPTRPPVAPPPPQAAAPSQCPDNLSAFAGSNEVLTCICPAEALGRGSVWGTDTYTADSGLCRAAQHAGMVGRQGGTVTVQMLPGQPRYPGTTRNGVSSVNYGPYDASFRFQGDPVRAQAAPAAGVPTQCPDTMSSYAGSDEVLACLCPAEALGRGAVWGTDTYTADSGLCRAAVHAGMIGRQGGVVRVQMLPGQPRYPGTTRNGISSSNYGPYDSSFRFQGEARPGQAAAPGAPAICPDNMSSYTGSDERLDCLCPGESTLRGSVWGTDTYTADSGLCRAAVHAGMIPATGGPVSVQMQPGQQRYPGTTRNGISSTNYGPYDASFRFLGTPRPGRGATGSLPVQAPVAETLQRTGQVQLYVTFRTGSADLDVSAAPVLGQVRDALAADPDLRLRLVGHTDSTGSPAINQPLSVRRAESVRQWLIANGVAATRLVTEGRGPSEPIADNTSEAGRSLNRRVQALRIGS